MSKTDAANDRILRELSRDGRISNIDLADRVGLSPSACLRRVAALERAVARAPEVVECHNITGAVEYLLRVEAADLSAYKTFHTDVLGVVPQVAAITTYVVMVSPKDQRA